MAITERLELSLDDALASIGQLDTALDAVATVTPVVDVSGVAGELEAAFASFVPSVSVTLSVDAGDIAEQLDGVLAGLSASVPVGLDLTAALDDAATIESNLVDGAHTFADVLLRALEAAANATVVLTDVDVSRLDESIAQALSSGADTPIVPTVDTGEITGEIDAAIAGSEGEVGVTVDTGSLSEDVTTAVESTEPTIEVAAETGALVDQVEGAIADVEPTVTVEADVESLAPAVTDALGSVEASVPVEAETDGMEAAVLGVLSSIDALLPIEADTGALSGDIESAIAGVDGLVTVDADTAGMLDAIDAVLAGVEASVTVDADASGIAAEVDAAVAGADTTITIDTELDASGIEGATESISQGTEQAAGSIDGLTGATAGMSAAFGLAQGEAAGVGSAISGIGAGAGAAVGAFTVVAGGAALLFDAALEAQAATERLNIVFGSMADSVQQIDVGGLTGDLSDLAVSIGSDDEALKQATATIGQFGQTAGATGPLVQRTAQYIDALALRSAALNPALGEAGEVAEKLTTALARGGRATNRFQIALDPLAIAARASKIALEDGRTEVTQFDKVAAGAALSVENLGNKLGKDFAAGSEQSVIKLKALRQSLEETLEAAGKPLVAPIMEGLEDFTPVAQELAESLGDLLSAVIPLAIDLASAFAPALEGAAAAAGVLVAPIQLLAEVIDLIPDPILQAAAAIAVLNLALNSTVAAKFTGGLVAAGATIADFAAKVRSAGLVTTLSTGGFLAGAVAVGGLSLAMYSALDALGFYDEAANRSADVSKKFGDELKDAALTADGFTPAVEKMVAAMNRGGTAVNAFGEASKALGISQRDVVTALAQGGGNLDALREKLIGAERTLANYDNASKVALNGQEVDADKARASVSKLREQLEAGAVAVEKATAAADKQIKKLEEQAVAEGALTEKQVARLKAQDTANNGDLNRVKFATDLTLAIQRQTEAEQAALKVAEGNAEALLVQSSALGGLTANWESLAGAIATGTVSLDNADEVTAKFGISAADLGAIIEQVNASVDAFISDSLAKLPQVEDAFASLADAADIDLSGALEASTSGDSVDLGAFTANLATQQADIAAFFDNVQAVAANGGTQLAAQLVALGAEAGGGLARSLAAASPAVLRETQNLLTPKVDAGALLAQLDAQAQQIEAFQLRVAAAFQQGQDDIALAALRVGPAQGNALLEGFQSAEPEVQAGILESLTGTSSTALEGFADFLNSPDIRGKIGEGASGIIDALDEAIPGLKLTEGLEEEVGKIPGVIAAGTGPAASAAALLSSEIGVASKGSLRAVPEEIGQALIDAGLAIDAKRPDLVGKLGGVGGDMTIRLTQDFNPSDPIGTELEAALGEITSRQPDFDAAMATLGATLNTPLVSPFASSAEPGLIPDEPKAKGTGPAAEQGRTAAEAFSSAMAEGLAGLGERVRPAIEAGFAGSANAGLVSGTQVGAGFAAAVGVGIVSAQQAIASAIGQATTGAGLGAAQAGISVGQALAGGIGAGVGVGAGAVATGTAAAVSNGAVRAAAQAGGAAVGAFFDVGLGQGIEAGGPALGGPVSAATNNGAVSAAALASGTGAGRMFSVGLGNGIISGIGTVAGQARSGGAQIGNAFVSGAAGAISGSTAISTAARGAVRRAVEAGKAEAGIESPSKVAAKEIGAPFAEGIAVGIDSASDSVSQSAADLLSAIEVDTPDIQITANITPDTDVLDSTLVAAAEPVTVPVGFDTGAVPTLDVETTLLADQTQIDQAFAQLTAGITVPVVVDAPTVDIDALVHVDTSEIDAALAQLALAPLVVDIPVQVTAPAVTGSVAVIPPSTATAPAGGRQMTDAQLLDAIRAAVRAESGIALNGPLIGSVSTTQQMDEEALAKKIAFEVGV